MKKRHLELKDREKLERLYAKGRRVEEIAAELKVHRSTIYNELRRGDTGEMDENGRVKDFLEEGTTDHKGIYRLTYHVAPYFERLQQDSFYPFIEVVFEIKDGKHYHVPITLSPYGYSTYRGN